MAVPFLSGAIEGFYGQPWTHAERVALFDWLAAWGLNTYLYAPKDDLKHRALWREPYTDEESGALQRLIEACHARGLHFIFGLSPGLDIRYGAEADRDRLRRRFDQLLTLGCRHFSLLFDDTSGRLDGGDADRWSSLAAAQSDVANGVFTWIRSRDRESRFVFCPTAYCGRMAQAGLGGPDYLSTVGRDLLPEIDIFWTGPEIISREISLAHARELGAMLRRKPIIWDNLHANDYDGRRFFCGPYSGRPLELRNEVNGLLSNPNNELPLNFVPLRTLAAFVRCHGAWDARSAYLSAMEEWLPHFATIGGAACFVRPDPLRRLLLPAARRGPESRRALSRRAQRAERGRTCRSSSKRPRASATSVLVCPNWAIGRSFTHSPAAPGICARSSTCLLDISTEG